MIVFKSPLKYHLYFQDINNYVHLFHLEIPNNINNLQQLFYFYNIEDTKSIFLKFNIYKLNCNKNNYCKLFYHFVPST